MYASPNTVGATSIDWPSYNDVKSGLDSAIVLSPDSQWFTAWFAAFPAFSGSMDSCLIWFRKNPLIRISLMRRIRGQRGLRFISILRFDKWFGFCGWNGVTLWFWRNWACCFVRKDGRCSFVGWYWFGYLLFSERPNRRSFSSRQSRLGRLVGRFRVQEHQSTS